MPACRQRTRWREGLGRGEHGPAKRAPDSAPEQRAQCAGPCTTSCKVRQECEVHRALSPSHDRPTPRRLSCASAQGGGRNRRRDMGAVRCKSRSEPSRLARATAPGSVLGEAIAAGVHLEGGRAATAARHRIAARQGRPACRRRDVAGFRTQATRHWRRALRRRSQRDRTNWKRMSRIATRWLPPAKITHPWPEKRFDVRTQGKSPVR